MRFIIVIVIAAFLGMAGIKFLGHSNIVSIRDAEVLDKDRITTVTDGNSESFYLIFTDKGEFKIQDDMIRGNHNSSKWYGSMRVGFTYNFQVDGFRNNTIVTSYQNIISTPKLSK